MVDPTNNVLLQWASGDNIALVYFIIFAIMVVVSVIELKCTKGINELWEEEELCDLYGIDFNKI